MGSIEKITATQYHRPLDTCFRYLRNAGFLVRDLREIVTKKKVQKVAKEEGDMRFRRSRYTTVAEKRIKELARKGIPFFLVLGAVKAGNIDFRNR